MPWPVCARTWRSWLDLHPVRAQPRGAAVANTSAACLPRCGYIYYPLCAMMSRAVARATARPATTWAQHARRLLQTTPQRLAYITASRPTGDGLCSRTRRPKAAALRPPPSALGRPPPP
eukprot:scaffold8086_cov93-Phaeocystis_antarctica.AAC.1